MLNRWKALALAIMMLGALTPALAEEAALPVMAGYEEEGSYRDWSANLFFQRMQARSGQAFTYQQYRGYDSWQKAKAALLEPGAELPSVLMKASLSPSETIRLLDAGVLIDLKPLLRESAPHLTGLLEAHPDSLQMITLPDGRIGALPYISESATQNCMWINTAWLATLKLAMPATAQELEEVLRAFRENDPNRNGSKDEVPLAFLGTYELKYLAHAYGLIANDYNVYAEGDEARFMPSEPAFKDFILWCRRLYSEGLLDKDGFVTADSLRRVTDAKATQRYGIVLGPLPTNLLPNEWISDYAVLPPLKYEGRQVYRNVAPRTVPGTFAITSACEDPARMLRWVDYLYSPEGAILAFAGHEGEDYLIDGDGTWRKTQGAMQSSFIDQATIASGSTPPGTSNEAFQTRYSDPGVKQVSEQIDIVAAVATDPFPPYALSLEQEQYIDPLQRAIGRYVDESIARFVMGEWEATDAQFALFYQELEALGLKDFMAFWQDVLDGRAEAVFELP